jgi:hypothetical protein
LLLFLWATITGRGAAARPLDEAPSITPFATAHVRIAGTVSAQGQELPVQGDGDIDATRGASHLTVGLLGAAFETIIVDGRTYSRNQATGRWEYTEGAGAGGFNAARLAPYDPATIRAAGRNFTRIGAEAIAGTATTRWRADVDLARLIGALPGAGPGGLDGSNSKMDLWIGDADERLRQLVIDAQGAASTASATPGPFRLNLALNFSNFDEPVPIIAPPGATAAATPSATLNGIPVARVTATSAAVSNGGVVISSALPTPNSRLAEATSGRGVLSGTVVIRFVAASSLVVVLLGVALAMRHRQQRQVALRDDESEGRA